MPKSERDINGELGEWAVTDWTEDLTLDCNTDDADLGDVLGTLIRQLIQKGIISGSVVAAA
jgi:hypothetical protein